MILLSHPTGNTFSRALLAGLLARRHLGLFATTIAFSGREPWLNILPRRLRNELLRRQFDVPAEKLYARPAREFVRVAMGKDADTIYRDLDGALARGLAGLTRRHNLSAVYAYEDGAQQLFRRAKDLGLQRCYELPIAYWQTAQRLLREEVERLPQWKQTMIRASDCAAKNQRKTEEAELADLIVCPSQFVYQSISASIRETRPCIIAEFGSPQRDKPPEFHQSGQKLRVLFAGAMTQRKGLADLFAAMKMLDRNDVELVVMGSLRAPLEFYRQQCPNFTYEPPRPHNEVLELMETCDVLVLPSIVEGRALVQQEAMSCGLILIATPNAGAQDLIDDGRAGFLVPIRSPRAIATHLDWLAQNRAVIPEMKRAAYEKASALSWSRYSETILSAIAELSAAPKSLRLANA